MQHPIALQHNLMKRADPGSLFTILVLLYQHLSSIVLRSNNQIN